MLKIRLTEHRGHINLKTVSEQPGWQRNVLPMTRNRLPSHSQTPPCLVISLFLSCICILLFSFMYVSLSLSGCLVLSPSQSFSHQHTISPSHTRSPAAPTHSVTLMSLQTISLTIMLRKLELILSFLLSSPYSCFFLALPSACVPSPALSLAPYLPFPFSISLARWRSLSPWHASRQLKKAMRHVQCWPFEPVTACPIREGFP